MVISMLKLDTLNDTNVNTEPFSYIVMENFLKQDSLDAARKDYTLVPGPGSLPPSGLKIHGGFKLLV